MRGHDSFMKDLFAGVIGVGAVAGLSWVAGFEVANHLPFSEPGSLTAIALAAVAYFYTVRQQEVSTQVQAAAVEAVKTGMNGATPNPAAPAPPDHAEPHPQAPPAGLPGQLVPPATSSPSAPRETT